MAPGATGGRPGWSGGARLAGAWRSPGDDRRARPAGPAWPPADGYPAPVRARDLGIVIGFGRPGPWNAITDVPGVRVGHQTLIRGDGPLVRGRGPVRTGVTVVVPHDRDIWTEPVFAGAHRLNGNGELTGLEWIREAGLLGGAGGGPTTTPLRAGRRARAGP